ncbi:MAG TPA: hypothetical protein VGI18_09400 [Burkholderiales bacterium]|jgi:hypothetical protein
MHAELIVPALLAAPGAARYPALELLLARGRGGSAEALTLEQSLAEAFAQSGALAAGALTMGEKAGDAWWARADPVHLRVLRDRAVVAPAEAFDLAPEEAEALITALNHHFSGRVEFHAAGPKHWAARLNTAHAFPGEPALSAAGRDPAAARGSDALLTEIQMLLHAHPVNEAREARGEPAVNSVWLWGGGPAPAEAGGPWRSVAAADPVARGLARLAGMRHDALPASAEPWLARLPEDGRHLAVLDALRAPAALEQHAAVEEGIAALERLWFAPLLAALRAERIGMVTLHVPDAGRSFETIRSDLRRIWRRPRRLAHYAPEAA